MKKRDSIGIVVTNPTVSRQHAGSAPIFSFKVHIPQWLFVEALTKKKGYTIDFITRQFALDDASRQRNFRFECHTMEDDMKKNFCRELNMEIRSNQQGTISDADGITLTLTSKPGMAGKLADLFKRAKQPFTFEDGLSTETLAAAEASVPSPERLPSQIKTFNALQTALERSVLWAIQMDASEIAKPGREVH